MSFIKKLVFLFSKFVLTIKMCTVAYELRRTQAAKKSESHFPNLIVGFKTNALNKMIIEIRMYTLYLAKGG